jgi:hypothetical protein
VSDVAKAIRARALEDANLARSILGANNVQLFGSVIPAPKQVGGRSLWTLYNASRLELWNGEVPGRWSLKLDITYDGDGLGRASRVFVRSGSFGLVWQPTESEKERSFVRYDVDVDRAVSLGEPCHFHVLQAGKFSDRLHFRIPAVSIEEWPMGPTLEFLCSSALRDEIRERLS